MTSFFNIRKQSGKVGSETLFSILILFSLASIGISILIQQGRYDKDLFSATVQQGPIQDPSSPGPGPKDPLSGIEPGGFEPMGGVETFDEETLSDKINGKAELYLGCGFVSLVCRRFVSRENAEEWFEVFIYDMALARQAFSVYSLQRRPGGKDLPILPYAYSTENALFFMTGKYYMEVVASTASETLQKALLETAEKIIPLYPSPDFSLPELSHLPRESRLDNTVKLFLTDAFGFEGMDNIVMVQYSLSGQDVAAFISLRESAEKAEERKQGYEKFLKGIAGGKAETHELDIPGMTVTSMGGEYEYLFTHGNILAGIHAAETRESGDALAVRMYERMTQVEK